MQNLHDALERYRVISIFIILVIIFSTIFVSICYAARGVLRQQANDPQVEVTDQVANIIRQGAPLDVIVSGAEQVDLANSSALFVMIYDKDKNLVGSSAVLDGQPLALPADALDKAKNFNDYRFDWQVSEYVKVAAIVKAVDETGYVVAAKSLAEYDRRADDLSQPLWIGWVISVLLALLLSSLLRPLRTLAIIEETNVTVLEDTK